jgi:chondroitin 4-sulfotransferase 11
MVDNKLTKLARRVIPRGSVLWYPYFYGKRWYRYVRDNQDSVPVLHYVLHNNILLEHQKAIYFYVPKVACSSIKTFCARLLGFSVETGETDFVEKIHRIDFPYVKKYRVRRYYQDYFRFCFVRNPWDRLVSCYKDKLNYHKGHVYERCDNSFIKFLKEMGLFKLNMTFDDFAKAVCDIPDEIADGHLRSQHTFITDEAGGELINFVGRFENLENDFRIVREKLGTNHDLPHLRKTTHKDYTTYYSEDCATRVFERYKKDIEQFAYQFNSSSE